MNTDVMFSSASDEWETPPELFAKLDAEFHFDLDVCATSRNAKCRSYITKKANGLRIDWGRRVCWMNPPYGRQIAGWMRKAYESSLAGATVVCLLPARTDTEWWHEYAIKGEVRFLRGRLRFVGAPASAPFPSAIVVFEPPGVE